MMLMPNNAVDRLIAYGKGLGLDDGPVGVHGSSVRFKRVEDPSTPDQPDYIALATTDDIDLSDEVVVPGGADTTYIKKNLKVFANHNYDNKDVVGTIRFLKAYPDTANQTGWQVRIKLVSTEEGETVRKIIEETGSMGLSIGFYPLDYGPPNADEVKRYSVGSKRPSGIVRTWNWFELSATALPCNKSCQMHSGLVADEKHAGEVERLVTKGVISRASAARLGLPITPARKIVPVKRTVVVRSSAI